MRKINFIFYWTNKNKWIIVESKMVTGRIKLGANLRLLRKPLSGDLLRGFFYGGVAEEFIGWEGWHSYNYGEQLRQHLILQAICVEQEVQPSTRTSSVLRVFRLFDSRREGLLVTLLCTPFFYDNPSSKRVARCTNILPTGATLTGVGEGQRLRKGFQNGGSGTHNGRSCESRTVSRNPDKQRTPAHFGSLSSAAKLRHSARNMRL